jgi:hypothetical protein
MAALTQSEPGYFCPPKIGNNTVSAMGAQSVRLKLIKYGKFAYLRLFLFLTFSQNNGGNLSECKYKRIIFAVIKE